MKEYKLLFGCVFFLSLFFQSGSVFSADIPLETLSSLVSSDYTFVIGGKSLKKQLKEYSKLFQSSEIESMLLDFLPSQKNSPEGMADLTQFIYKGIEEKNCVIAGYDNPLKENLKMMIVIHPVLEAEFKNRLSGISANKNCRKLEAKAGELWLTGNDLVFWNKDIMCISSSQILIDRFSEDLEGYFRNINQAVNTDGNPFETLFYLNIDKILFYLKGYTLTENSKWSFISDLEKIRLFLRKDEKNCEVKILTSFKEDQDFPVLTKYWSDKKELLLKMATTMDFQKMNSLLEIIRKKSSFMKKYEKTFEKVLSGLDHQVFLGIEDLNEKLSSFPIPVLLTRIKNPEDKDFYLRVLSELFEKEWLLPLGVNENIYYTIIPMVKGLEPGFTIASEIIYFSVNQTIIKEYSVNSELLTDNSDNYIFKLELNLEKLILILDKYQKEKIRERKNRCLMNLQKLEETIQKYNQKTTGKPMLKPDISLLIEKKFLDKVFLCPASGEYDRKMGKLYCSVHGNKNSEITEKVNYNIRDFIFQDFQGSGKFLHPRLLESYFHLRIK